MIRVSLNMNNDIGQAHNKPTFIIIGKGGGLELLDGSTDDTVGALFDGHALRVSGMRTQVLPLPASKAKEKHFSAIWEEIEMEPPAVASLLMFLRQMGWRADASRAPSKSLALTQAFNEGKTILPDMVNCLA